MSSWFDQIGAHWRAFRRLKRSQLAGRLRLRLRQKRIGLFGMTRALPRRRGALARDWESRMDNFNAAKGDESPRLWAEVAGLRFRGNAEWLAAGAGRALLYERDLSRLELYYHDFMNQGVVGPSEGWSFLESYMKSHLQRAADSRYEWHPYAVSNRLASWLTFVAGATSPGRKELREEVASECLLLADYVTWLQEWDIEANHLLKNLWSIALCDLLLSPDREAVQASLRAYLKELDCQMLPDGGHYELSPMYHAKVLLDARVIEGLAREEDPAKKPLREIIRKAETWLEAMRISPTSWANVNDSWSMPRLAQRLWKDRPWDPVAGLTHLEDSGFVRGDQGDWGWLLDVGGASPLCNPGHSHSDALSVIIYHEGMPLIVDPGVLHYSPNDERRFLKSCHAHNGPCLRDSDYTELIGSFRVGKSSAAQLKELHSGSDEQSVTATLDGYAGLNVQRKVRARVDAIEIVDTWDFRSKNRSAIWSRFLWNANLSEVVGCCVDENGISFEIRLVDRRVGLYIEVRASGVLSPRIGVQESYYSDEFGKRISAVETIVSGKCDDRSAQIRTIIRTGSSH